MLLLPEGESEQLSTGVIDGIRYRLRDKNGKVKRRYIYALQAPLMLLMLSVMTFLAGLCSVIFSPLARNLTWNADAKVCHHEWEASVT